MRAPGFYFSSFPSLGGELSVLYIFEYRNSPIWSSFQFFFEDFMRLVAGIMDSLLGGSSGGSCPTGPERDVLGVD
ncbi:hypothetical protein DY000_02027212 [Brassica cretica]|uniref:Uncharacterized protein n=1 Tax=Brassica cretica TaxID=69181 RepID=A0ABQ7EDN8_BRACR|nr:hypothetical protein DY000_02027212 [Brassica cretica]